MVPEVRDDADSTAPGVEETEADPWTSAGAEWLPKFFPRFFLHGSPNFFPLRRFDDELWRRFLTDDDAPSPVGQVRRASFDPRCAVCL